MKKKQRIKELESALADLVAYAEQQTCLHEDTYRGGCIWEICRECGARWADGEGGKSEYVEPKQIQRAYQLLNESQRTS